jgi:uncharacterized protein YfiM (DUF2279 family)
MPSADPDPAVRAHPTFRQLSGCAQETRGPTDRWFAADKARHFMLSFGVVGFTFAGLRTAGMDRPSANVAAVVAAAGAGLGKELSDLRRGRGFSFRDLVWDAAGIAVGALLMQNTR